MTINSRVLAMAETWIGTPYRHQGSARGVGCDCLGLVRGIWRELYGREPEPVPAYAADWAERSGEERLLDAAGRHFRPVARLCDARAGDLVIFRFRQGCAAKHAGILAGHCLSARSDEALRCEKVQHESDPGGGMRGHPVAAPGRFIHAPDHFIHAYEQSAVTRSALVPAWRRRIAGLYRFPEV